MDFYFRPGFTPYIHTPELKIKYTFRLFLHGYTVRIQGVRRTLGTCIEIQRKISSNVQNRICILLFIALHNVLFVRLSLFPFESFFILF